MFVEPTLDGLEDMPMLPTRDPALAAGRALGFERTGQTGRRPIAAQRLAVLLIRIPIGQSLAGRAQIDIVLGDIDEVRRFAMIVQAPGGLNNELMHRRRPAVGGRWPPPDCMRSSFSYASMSQRYQTLTCGSPSPLRDRGD